LALGFLSLAFQVLGFERLLGGVRNGLHGFRCRRGDWLDGCHGRGGFVGDRLGLGGYRRGLRRRSGLGGGFGCSGLTGQARGLFLLTAADLARVIGCAASRAGRYGSRSHGRRLDHGGLRCRCADFLGPGRGGHRLDGRSLGHGRRGFRGRLARAGLLDDRLRFGLGFLGFRLGSGRGGGDAVGGFAGQGGGHGAGRDQAGILRCVRILFRALGRQQTGFLLALAAVAAATLATGAAARTIMLAAFLLMSLAFLGIQQLFFHGLHRLGTRPALLTVRAFLALRTLGALAAGLRGLLRLACLTLFAGLTILARLATVATLLAGALGGFAAGRLGGLVGLVLAQAADQAADLAQEAGAGGGGQRRRRGGGRGGRGRAVMGNGLYRGFLANQGAGGAD